MKLKAITINGFKNLNDFQVIFDEKSTINSFIGNNGSGKSNIIEAITAIFSALLVGEDELTFEFKMQYTIDDSLIEIDNLLGKMSVTKNGKKVTNPKVRSILPTALFLYYAGETDRLRSLSEKQVDKHFDNALKNDEETVLKFITYLSVDDFGISLLSNFIFKAPRFDDVAEFIGFEDLSMPIELVFGKPSWGKPKSAKNHWNARGTVENLLNKYKDMGLVEYVDDDSFKIIIDDVEHMRDETLGPMGIFKELKLLSQTGVLKDTTFNVKKNGKVFSYKHFSEGEKQIGQLLSVLDITKDYKGLFLLDEMDSYLHPNWQRRFTDLISSINIRGQILFATHSPLTLGKMNRENIFVIRQGKAYRPSTATLNRDVSEILEELMEVSLRPKQIETMINEFKRAALVEKDKEKAANCMKKLSSVLSEDDPFFITANMTMDRLG